MVHNNNALAYHQTVPVRAKLC